MKIYTAIWKDRHTDTTAHPFSSADKAVKWAKDQALRACRDKEDYSEEIVSGWLVCVNYSCEGDCIYVTESELDNP